MPGFGDESSAKTPFTVQENTDFLHERFLEKRKSQTNWGVIGLSLGGMIALDWAYRYSKDFTALVIINSSARDLSPTYQRYSPYAMYTAILTTFLKTPNDFVRQQLKMISNLKINDKAVLDDLIKIAQDSKVTKEKLFRQTFAASRFVCPDKISISTLVLTSMKDAMVDVRCSKALAEKLNAQIKFHPTAGHDLTLDDPQWVIDRIQTFIGELSSL